MNTIPLCFSAAVGLFIAFITSFGMGRAVQLLRVTHLPEFMLCALGIARGLKGYSTLFVHCHGIVVFFVSLDTCSKLDPAVFVVVGAEAGNDSPWTHRG